jgi:hypothetical protein
MKRRRTTMAAVLIALPACIGEVGEGADQTEAPAAAPGPAAPGAARPLPDRACDPAAAATAWEVPIRRLTRAEIERAIQVALEVNPVALPDRLPADATEEHGFSNQSRTLGITEGFMSRLQLVAEDAAERFAADAGARMRVAGCDPARDNMCVKKFIDRVGRRLFRRPLTAAEAASLSALAATFADPANAWAQLRVVVEALLQSPSFLFRVEVGAPIAGAPARARLGGYEIAARLSFLLFGAPPDDALLDAAATGQLDTPAGIEARVRAMLADPRARGAVTQFASEWLELPRLADMQRSKTVYRQFTESLRAAMGQEVSLLLDEHLWNGNLLDLLTAGFGYANAELGSLYGLPAGRTKDLTRVDWAADSARGGLLSSAGMLALTANGDNPSPVARGLFVRRALLCDAPSLPAGVPTTEAAQGESASDTQDRHTRTPGCAACHLMIDPVGWGLDRYDALGKLRTTNEVGRPVRDKGNVLGLQGRDGAVDFADARELGRVLHDAPQTPGCMVRQLLGWTFGREAPGDEAAACAVEQLRGGFARTGYRFPELLVALATSDLFRNLQRGE